MMSRLSKAVILGFLTGIVGLGVSLLPFGVDLEENVGLDLLFNLRGTSQPPSDVIVVSIDQKSAEHLNISKDPRKWSRSLHARLTENLVKEGAMVVAFDLIFDEVKSPEDDHLFAEAIGKARNVVLCESLKSEKVPLTTKGGTPGGNLNIERLVSPILPLAQSAVALAPFPLPKVPVKVSQYWTFKTEAGDTPTLPVVAFQVFGMQVYEEFIRLLKKVSPSKAEKLPDSNDAIIATRGVENVIREIRDIFQNEPLIAERMLKELQNERILSAEPKKNQILKSLIIMYQAPNSAHLNFCGPPGTIPTIPYYQVLEPQGKETPKQKQFDFSGKAVFVGLSDRSPLDQKDGFNTVFSEKSGLDLSGVEIAATAFANLLEDRPVRPLSPWVSFATLLLWGVLIGMVCYLLPTFVAAISILGLIVLYFIVTAYQFKASGSWYPFVLPLLIQSPLAFFGAVVWKNIEVNQERQKISEALQKIRNILPDGVFDQLSKNIKNIKGTGQLGYGICLYTDIEDFTTIAESKKKNPEKLSTLMNKYWEVLFKPVKQYGGIIFATAGDSMLAGWVTEKPDASLRNQACQAGLDIARAVDQFNESQSSDEDKFPTRIGLHSGDILLGAIGAMDHYEYGPLGDIVNTVQRIEGLNKPLHTRILVSEEGIDQLDGFLTRELGRFLLKGKIESISIYELLCRKEGSNDQQRIKCMTFAKVLDPFRKGYWKEAEEAIEKFQESIKSYGEDGPSLFFLDLCQKYMKNPPGEPWDGVVPMEEK
jgi:adenylate cyclase